MRERSWLIKLRGNLTQEQVALLSGISRSAYSNIEIGLRAPSVPTAKKIAKALSFKWQKFFEEERHVKKQKSAS